MHWDLIFHLLVSTFVSLSVLQHIGVFVIVRLVQNTFVCIEGWLGLESEFGYKLRFWEFWIILTVHSVIIKVLVSCSRSWSSSPTLYIGLCRNQTVWRTAVYPQMLIFMERWSENSLKTGKNCVSIKFDIIGNVKISVVLGFREPF
jgi:hypothetical protein